MNKIKILVTGCGGDIGQSIGKILKSKPDIFNLVLGADIHEDHAGKFIFDNCKVLPRADSNQYRDAVQELISKYKIDLVIPVSEPELRNMTKKYYENDFYGKPTVMANLVSREIGFDKKATADFLFSHQLPFPKTEHISEYSQSNYPVLIKSRDGSGSKSIHVVNNSDEMKLYKKIYPDFITQQLLRDDGGEFTCGLFRSASGDIRDIILKRKLMGGFSGFGIREEHPLISKFLHQIAVLLDLNGSINVQLRLVNDVPYVFEINPRFSSTVLFRHLMGYEDLMWSIQDKLNLPLDSYTVNQNITKFYKGFNEYVD